MAYLGGGNKPFRGGGRAQIDRSFSGEPPANRGMPRGMPQGGMRMGYGGNPMSDSLRSGNFMGGGMPQGGGQGMRRDGGPQMQFMQSGGRGMPQGGGRGMQFMQGGGRGRPFMQGGGGGGGQGPFNFNQTPGGMSFSFRGGPGDMGGFEDALSKFSEMSGGRFNTDALRDMFSNFQDKFAQQKQNYSGQGGWDFSGSRKPHRWYGRGRKPQGDDVGDEGVVDDAAAVTDPAAADVEPAFVPPSVHEQIETTDTLDPVVAEPIPDPVAPTGPGYEQPGWGGGMMRRGPRQGPARDNWRYRGNPYATGQKQGIRSGRGGYYG